MTRGGEPWGHSITTSSRRSRREPTPADLMDGPRRLDKHYIPSRYPNGFAPGILREPYTRGEAEGAIADAETILEFCRRRLP